MSAPPRAWAPRLLGTTLALSVSRVIAAEAGGDPRRVARVVGRFNAMVPMPQALTLRILAREPADGAEVVYFETLNEEGGRAVADAAIGLRE